MTPEWCSGKIAFMFERHQMARNMAEAARRAPGVKRVEVPQNLEKRGLDSYVQFRLTKYGKEVYRNWVESTLPAGKVGGHDLRKFALSEIQLWQAMLIFGKEMGAAKQNMVFKNNELFFPKP